MNRYKSHTHIPSDIIGLGSSILSNLGGTNNTSGSSGSYTFNPSLLLSILAAPGDIYGVSTFAARSDHRHPNILQSHPLSGNISVAYLNGLYTINLFRNVTGITLGPTNTLNISDDKFTLQNSDITSKEIQFDLSQITPNSKKVYQWPDTNGVVMVTSRLADNSVILPPQDGPLPPYINALSSDSVSGVSGATMRVVVEYSGTAQFNLSSLRLEYIEYNKVLSVFQDFLYPQATEDDRASNIWPARLSVIGLIYGKIYKFRVKAFNAAGGESLWSEFVILKTIKDSQPPLTPENFTVQYIGGTSENRIMAQWANNAEDDLWRYELYKHTNKNEVIVLSDTITASPDLLYSGTLNMCTRTIDTKVPVYYFSLVAVDYSGNRSDPDMVMLSVPLAPSEPVLTDVQIVSDALANSKPRISITFNDSSPCAGILPYVYQLIPTSSKYSIRELIGSPATLGGDASFTITNVIGNIDYTIKIASISNLNIRSNFVSAGPKFRSAKSKIEPSEPINISATPGFGTIDLKWTNSSDDDLDSVNIYKSLYNDSASATQITNITGTYFSDKDIIPTQAYYYWLKSKNTSDLESIFSNGVSGISIQMMPSFLDTSSRVDCVVKDIIFQFDHVESGPASKILSWASTGGGILNNGTLYSLAASSMPDADNIYLIAVLTGKDDIPTASLRPSKFPAQPKLEPNEHIIAVTSTEPLKDTNNYVCYVRQANSIAIEGALIRDATITNAKIQSLKADKIEANTITSLQISAGAITADTIAAGAITTEKIDTGASRVPQSPRRLP